MSLPLQFGLNHMVAPRQDLKGFFALAAGLGVKHVEIRNDLAGVAIGDGTSPEAVAALAAEAGLTIASINALQRFNHWTRDRAEEARFLIDYARRCGAKALVLCPVNDTAFAPPTPERLAMLGESLSALRPLLEEAGVIGLVEPLGFVECSLRLKREAVDAIATVGAHDRFKLVHDTFHHFVAGETEIFPETTGLIHASGVVDGAVDASRMRDPHRVLVDRDDRIDTIGQVRALRAGGYRGLVSFEPFAASVHASDRIAAELRDSMTDMAQSLGQAGA